MSTYSPLEEKANIGTHAFGWIMSGIALFLLLQRALPSGDILHTIAFAVFGLSIMVLYAASTLYHSATDPVRRARLRIFDHAAIYVLIAGTYTPFTLLVLPSPIGTILLAAVWLMAVAGIIIKLFFTVRFKLFSTLMYVSMGWLIVFAFNPLLESMEPHGLQWLLAGGIAYTVGAVLYSIKKLPFNHAIFHVFVLAGTFCHFIAVYQYCLP